MQTPMSLSEYRTVRRALLAAAQAARAARSLDRRGRAQFSLLALRALAKRHGVQS